MKRFIEEFWIDFTVLAVVFLLLWGGLVLIDHVSAQDAKPKYVPSDVQSLRLQLAQQRAINAQQTLIDACGDGPTMSGKTPGSLRAAFQSQLDALSQEAAKVRKENGWPDTVGFDQGNLTFSEMPPNTTKPTAPPAAKESK